MKRLRRIILLCFVVAMILPACAPVPDDVQQDVEAFDKAREEAKELEKEKNLIPVKDVYDSTPKTFKYENGTLKIDAKVCVPQADTMYKLKLEVNDLYAEKDVLLKAFLDEENYNNWQNLEYRDVPPGESEDKEYGASGDFRIPFDEKMISFDRKGWFSLYDTTKTMDEHFFVINATPTSEIFYYDEIDENFSETIVLNGETCNALDVWKNFEESLNYFSQRVPKFNFKPYFLRFYDSSENPSSKAVSCCAVCEYDGVYFDYVYLGGQDTKNYDTSRVLTSFNQNFHSLNDDCFRAIRDSYNVTDELETYNEVIDLDSAIKFLQPALAKERFAEIENIELVYSIYYYGEEGDSWAENLEQAPEFYAQPYWKFSEKDKEDEEDEEDGRWAVHYVNAVTGEFYSCGDASYA